MKVKKKKRVKIRASVEEDASVALDQSLLAPAGEVRRVKKRARLSSAAGGDPVESGCSGAEPGKTKKLKKRSHPEPGNDVASALKPGTRQNKSARLACSLVADEWGTSISAQAEQPERSAKSFSSDEELIANAPDKAPSMTDCEDNLESHRNALRMLDEVMEQPDEDGGDINEDELRHKTTKEERAEAAQKRKVFIGNLPFATDPESIEQYFEDSCGAIDSFNMPLNKETGKPMGVAFVVFCSEEAVEKVLAYNGTIYGERKLRVSVADPTAKPKNMNPTEGRVDGMSPGKANNERESRGKGSGKSGGRGNGKDWERSRETGRDGSKGKGGGSGKDGDRGKGSGKGKAKGKGKGKDWSRAWSRAS